MRVTYPCDSVIRGFLQNHGLFLHYYDRELLLTDGLDPEIFHFKDIVLMWAYRLVAAQVRLTEQARDVAFAVTDVELKVL